MFPSWVHSQVLGCLGSMSERWMSQKTEAKQDPLGPGGFLQSETPVLL